MSALRNLCVLAAVVAGCGGPGSSTPPEVTTGRARLSLSGTGTDGFTYRIVGYTLRIVGPQSLVVPETPDETVALTLRAGHYTVALEGDWHVERADLPGVPVDVELVSPNPLAFAVWQDEETPVRFAFKLPSEGNVAVTMGVDSGGWISGTFEIAGIDDPGATHDFDALLGVSVPFTISWEDARVTREPFRTSLDAPSALVQFGEPANATLDELAQALFQTSLRVDLDSLDAGVLVTASPMLSYLGFVEYGLALTFPVPASGSLDESGAPRLGTYLTDAELRLTRGRAAATATAHVSLVAR